MMNQIGRPDQLEIRLTAWILYLLRGGKPEALQRIVMSEAYPRSKSYRILLSILADEQSGFDANMDAEDRDLLIGENPGHALDLDLNDPLDQARLKKVRALARLVLLKLQRSEATVLRKQGLFSDKEGRRVDIDLTIERKHLEQLAGDLLFRQAQEAQMLEDYREAADWPVRVPTAYLFSRRSQSLLRVLLDRSTPAEPIHDSSSMESWLVLNSLSSQDDLVPYAEQLLSRDVAILALGSGAPFHLTEQAGIAEPDLPTGGVTSFVDIDLRLTQRLRQEDWQIPDRLSSYVLLHLISIGPRSSTYSAEDVESIERRKLVVLKILHPHYPDEHLAPPSLDSHEAILRHQRFLRDGRFIFFVMEYMPGGNLEKLIRSLSGSLRFRLTLRALSAVCEALSFAHCHGVSHGAIEAEKILFSLQSQRFKLAYSTLVDANLTDEGQRTQAMQKDLHDVGAVFADLLSNTRIPWLHDILKRCQDRGFQDARELLLAVTAYLEPEKSPLIVLTADYDEEKQKIHYHLDIEGSRYPELLTFNVRHRLISALYARWDSIGELALEHAAAMRRGSSLDTLNRRIQELLSGVSDAETHRVLGPKVRRGLERNSQTVLWVRYHPSLSSVPWELLEISGLRLCRQFHIARSPLLFTEVEHHGLPKERRIKLLIIEDPDGDLNGARAECNLLRGEIKHSPLSDRIEVSTVGAGTDPLIINRKILEADIVHFAGHGLFDERYTEDSGLSLGAGDVLSGGEVLNGFWLEKRPFLVFANACDSGRNHQQAVRQRVYSDAATGLGQAFLASGVSNYIGALWKAPDGDATIDFAIEFYRWFLSGCTVSRAIRAARDFCFGKYGEEDLTWARYVLFGHPLNHIEI